MAMVLCIFTCMQNRKALRNLILANAISGFAQGISMIAIPWYIIHTMNEEKVYSQVFFIVTLAILLWGPYAGTLIDRYQRKDLFIGLCSVGAVTLLAATLSGYYWGEVPFPLVVAVYAFTILNYNLHYPALYAFSQELSEKKNYGKVNSMLEVQSQATSMLSGAAAALLLGGLNDSYSWIEPWELHEIFLADGITYVLAVIIISRIKYIPVTQEEIDRSSLFHRLMKGFQYLKAHPYIFIFGLCSYVVFATLIVHGFMLMQLYLDNVLLAGGMALAITELMYTLGALSSGLFVRKVFSKIKPVDGIIFMMFLTVSILLLMAFTQNLYVFLFCNMIYGMCNSGIRILRVTWLFENVPNRMMGRAGSVFNNFNIVFRLIFIFIFGTGTFLANVDFAFLLMAGVITLMIIPLLVVRKKLA